MKKVLIGALFLIGGSLFLGNEAFACILCAYSGGDGPECELVVGETGGRSCYINCGTTAGTFRCYCRTLGDCSGTNACDGQPCPVAHRKGLEFFAPPETKRAAVYLTRQQIKALESQNPEAAGLIATFAKDNDALLIGLKDAIPFVPGEYKGLVTEAPVVAAGAKGPVKIYRYEATVIQEGDGVVIRVELFDHPTMRRLHAQIGSSFSENIIEVISREGSVKRIEI
ncbi:MAG TPA: hypothetical protein VF789_16945 [Thermoanaerobaculia bacterium]